MPFPPSIARILCQALGDEKTHELIETLDFADAGHGYDQFGLHPAFVGLGSVITNPLYRHYFRVRSFGHEHIPQHGPAVLAANHSGTLPIDGAMLWLDVLRHTSPPRVPRPIADYFVPSLPIIGNLFARCGMVGGSRGNARALLRDEQLLMIFPEGVPGIGKLYSERYQLQEWRQGHCELAIRHQAPVIPVGIVGAEEQMPQIARVPIPGPLPHIPIPATFMPLPVRYYILYGEPIRLDAFDPADADDPAAVKEAAAQVKAAVAALLKEGLEKRQGVFR